MGKVTSLADLDGDYDVTYQAEAPTLQNFVWADHTAALVRVSNGEMLGIDNGGSQWKASLSLVAEPNTLEFIANVNVQSAPPTTFLLNKNGQPTRDSQVYTGILNIAAVGDHLSVYGSVSHGIINIKINMKRK